MVGDSSAAKVLAPPFTLREITGIFLLGRYTEIYFHYEKWQKHINKVLQLELLILKEKKKKAMQVESLEERERKTEERGRQSLRCDCTHHP